MQVFQAIGRNNRVVINLEVEGVIARDYPDFCDAFFAYGVYQDTGEILTSEELDELTDTNGDVINEMAHDSFTGYCDYEYDRMRDAEYDLA